MAHYKGAASEAGRAMHLMKKREKAQMEIEFRRKKIEEDLKLANIETKFATHFDAVEQQLKSTTIGLVTLDEMKARQLNIVKEQEKKLAQKNLEKEKEKQRQLEAKQAEKNKQKQQIQALSFTLDGDEEEEKVEEEEMEEEDDTEEKKRKNSDEDEKYVSKKKIKKNPDVDTSFLPDREREEEETKLREELRQEWATKQSSLKEEEIDITFSYWDGSGHRKTLKMKKGNTIYQFLQKCLEILRKEFSELKTITADQLMYVKEDLILPHHYSFYDFIVTKARGKSGPLFTFDVHDDIRMVNDAGIEKEDSHAELENVTTNASIIDAANRAASSILQLKFEDFKKDMTASFLTAMEDLLTHPSSDECKKRIENIGNVAAIGDYISPWEEINKVTMSGKLDDALIKELKQTTSLEYEIRIYLDSIPNSQNKINYARLQNDSGRINERLVDGWILRKMLRSPISEVLNQVISSGSEQSIKFSSPQDLMQYITPILKQAIKAIIEFNKDEDVDILYQAIRDANNQGLEMIGKSYSNDEIRNAIKTGKFDFENRLLLRQADEIIAEINHDTIKKELLNDVLAVSEMQDLKKYYASSSAAHGEDEE